MCACHEALWLVSTPLPFLHVIVSREPCLTCCAMGGGGGGGGGVTPIGPVLAPTTAVKWPRWKT